VIPDLPVGDRFLLQPVTPGDGRHEAAVKLLTGGWRSVAEVLGWAEGGHVYVLHDPAAPAPAGAAVAVLTVPVGSGATEEIRLLEIAGHGRDSDAGLRLLLELADALRSRGVRRAVAGVGNAEVGRMQLLVRAGFRMTYVERDGCSSERGWIGAGDGVPNRDVLWLEIDL
jgi:hypothetical protein